MHLRSGIGVSGWAEVEDDWKYCVVGNERILQGQWIAAAVRPAAQGTQLILVSKAKPNHTLQAVPTAAASARCVRSMVTIVITNLVV